MWDEDRWDAISAWCVAELGAAPSRELFARQQASEVVGVQLTDGRTVVVKTRHDEEHRAASCVAVQAALAADGFPCARPLTEVTFVDGSAVHAEELLPGGEVRLGDDVATAGLFGRLFGRLQNLMCRIPPSETPPLPNPSWVRWDESELFPLLWWQDWWVVDAPMPAIVTATALRARERIAAARLPSVIGHADWETQNIRWVGDTAHAVHDWDSLAWVPEAALVGVASGTFASNTAPTLAPVESSAAFIEAYEDIRGRPLSMVEREVAWAASLWPAAYNARTQILYDKDPVALRALQAQAGERLSLARA